MHRVPFSPLVTRACAPVGVRTLAARSFAAGSGLPGDRLPVLRQLLDQYKGEGRVVRVLETHNGLTGLIAETTSVEVDGKTVDFDGMWSSSLTASAAKGKPVRRLLHREHKRDAALYPSACPAKPSTFHGHALSAAPPSSARPPL